MLSATCNYRLNDLYLRISRLVIESDHAYDAHDAVSVLGIPQFEEPFVGPYYTFYTMHMSGPDGWQLDLLVDEEAKFDELDLRLKLSPPVEQRDKCFPFDRLFKDAESSGWLRQAPGYVTDGGTPGVGFEKGAKSFYVDSYGSACMDAIELKRLSTDT